MTFKSKKGVSALIASVLMIVVVVGIGAVVTGIVRNYVMENKQTIEKTATDVQCSTQVQINVPTYNDAYRICNDSSAVHFTLENTGSMAIDNLQVKVFGSTGMVDVNNVMPTGLAPGQVNTSLSAAYTGIGTLEEVRIIPMKKVTASANQIYCNEAALKFALTDISNCQP
jgi:FlaG/FlaF family flagellin (archaellin)